MPNKLCPAQSGLAVPCKIAVPDRGLPLIRPPSFSFFPSTLLHPRPTNRRNQPLSRGRWPPFSLLLSFSATPTLLVLLSLDFCVCSCWSLGRACFRSSHHIASSSHRGTSRNTTHSLVAGRWSLVAFRFFIYHLHHYIIPHDTDVLTPSQSPKSLADISSTKGNI